MHIKIILFFLLRLIVGAVFIFSAYTKLYPIELFEIKFVETGFIGWSIAPFVARLLAAFEFLLGILIILNIQPRLTVKTIIVVLVFFTIYLIYLVFFKPEEQDCGCFGYYFKMSPGISILKNIVLLATCYVLIKYDNSKVQWKYLKFLTWALILSSIALPFILNPVDIAQSDAVNNEAIGYQLDVSRIGTINDGGKEIRLDEGKKIIGFFSMHCRFCKLSARKLNIIQSKLKKPLPMYYVFFGNEDDMEQFWNEAQGRSTPHKIIPADVFLKISGSSLPAIFFLDNGKVVNKLKFLTLSQDKVEEFLK